MPATRTPVPSVVDPAEAVVVVAEPVPAPRHRIGCPEGRGREGNALEVFEATAPNGTVLRVCRCVDCGEQVLIP